MIKIKYEKIMDRGDKLVKFIGFEGPTENEVPLEYLRFKPVAYMARLAGNKEDSLYVRAAGVLQYMSVGDTVGTTYFKEILKSLCAAEKRLDEINKRVEEDTKTWVGTHDVTISSDISIDI